jgi:FkbM family methyltransferase
MLDWLKRLLTRPRVLVRSCRKLGVRATLRLVAIRFGSPNRTYQVRVPQWTHPVHVRGGRSTDTTVLYEILVTEEYSLAPVLDSPKVVVDGGANIGMASAYFLNRYPSTRVISVEPFQAAAALCRKNLEPYGQRATVVQGAIWPVEGSVCLDPMEEDTRNRVRPSNSGEAASVQAVTMKSLVTLAGGSVDLLKLDVEGSEREIFGTGAAEWLPEVRNILIELHGPDCETRVFGAVAGYDYELLGHGKMNSALAVWLLKNLRPKQVSPAGAPPR